MLSDPDSEATPEWNNYFKGEGGLFAGDEGSADNGSVNEIGIKNSIDKINALLLKPKDTSKGVQRERIGKVQDAEIDLIKNELDIDVTGYDHTVDVSEINHTKKRHSNQKIETARKQIALTNDDFKSIPYVITSPDKIEYSGKNDKGLETIKYQKQIIDGNIQMNMRVIPTLTPMNTRRNLQVLMTKPPLRRHPIAQ
ncbi:hypothetical protein FACS1894102_5030 [Spirochaetia bacterium]|nr:hypothetical protein FACS1894102_5030 [Spirochaetia bacterium]